MTGTRVWNADSKLDLLSLEKNCVPEIKPEKALSLVLLGKNSKAALGTVGDKSRRKASISATECISYLDCQHDIWVREGKKAIHLRKLWLQWFQLSVKEFE